MTIAERWWDVLEDPHAEMSKESVKRYTTRAGEEILLFKDDSVYIFDTDLLTMAELLEGNDPTPNNLVRSPFDGLIRTFWPGTVPSIGDMGLLFDTNTFSCFAYEREYLFSFGTWSERVQENGPEYTVTVTALLNFHNKDREPAAHNFSLRVSDHESSGRYDVDYSAMPTPEPAASWNNPRHWQNILADMKSHCAAVAQKLCSDSVDDERTTSK
jgi:hypothetical protein